MSVLAGAPHREEAPQHSRTSSTMQHVFTHRQNKRSRQTALCTLAHTEHRRQLPEAVGTASSLAPPFI